MKKEPTIVYLATRGSYSDYRVLGVFSTREKAQARIDDEIKANNGYDYDSAIEEVMLDNNGYLPDHYKVCRVRMDRGGNVAEADCDPSNSWVYQDHFVTGNAHQRWFGMMARNAEHAIKIANERRTQMIANNEWPTV